MTFLYIGSAESVETQVVDITNEQLGNDEGMMKAGGMLNERKARTIIASFCIGALKYDQEATGNQVSTINLEQSALHKARVLEIAREQDNRELNFVIEVPWASLKGKLSDIVKTNGWHLTEQYRIVYWDKENRRRSIQVATITNNSWICDRINTRVATRSIARTGDNRTIREVVLEGTLLTREISIVDRDGRQAFVRDNDEAGQYWDDLTGKQLDNHLVRKARDEKMREFSKHAVYEKVDIQECWDNTGKEPT